MTAQTGVLALLSADADLAAVMGVAPEVLPDRVLRAGVKDIPDLCLVIRWEETPLLGGMATQRFTLRGHHRSETYGIIDAMLDRAKDRLTAVVHEEGISQIDWAGRSPDLIDDGHRTLTRFDTYVVAAGLTARKEV